MAKPIPAQDDVLVLDHSHKSVRRVSCGGIREDSGGQRGAEMKGSGFSRIQPQE